MVRPGRARREDELIDATGPERIRAMLQQLGPTYVKIGQMMASRGDILPRRVDRRTGEAPERGRAVRLGGRRDIITKELGANPEACSRRSSTSRSPRRPRPRSIGRRCRTGRSSRSRSSGPGSRQDPGGPRASSRNSRSSRSSGSAIARKVGLRASSASSRRASSRSSTTERGVSRPAPRRRDDPVPGGPRAGRLRRPLEPARHHDGVRRGHQALEGRRAPSGGLRYDRARDRVHPGDHQAGPRRRLLPRRSAPRQHPGGPERQADRVPGPRARRPARTRPSGWTCSG